MKLITHTHPSRIPRFLKIPEMRTIQVTNFIKDPLSLCPNT